MGCQHPQDSVGSFLYVCCVAVRPPVSGDLAITHECVRWDTHPLDVSRDVGWGRSSGRCVWQTDTHGLPYAALPCTWEAAASGGGGNT